MATHGLSKGALSVFEILLVAPKLLRLVDVRALLPAIAIVALVAPASADDADTKSPTAAVVLSSAGTLAAYLSLGYSRGSSGSQDLRLAVEISTWTVLPSLGHLYVHHWVSKGLVIRTLGMAGVILGAEQDCEDIPCSGTLLFVASLGVVITGAIWDMASASSAARDYNAEHAHVTMTPTILTPPSGPVVGLGIAGSF